MTETTFDAIREEVQGPQLTASQRHGVLADEQRRVAAEVLADREDPVDLQTLARAVTARSGEYDESRLQQVRITLHHTHLPLLDEVGIVEYDVESHRVRPRAEVLDHL